MSLLFSLNAGLRRSGKTDLILAHVDRVEELPCDEAYKRFPAEAEACDLKRLCAGWKCRTVVCISFSGARVDPSLVNLGRGNQGFLRQFSLENGTPQFCARQDLGKTVSLRLSKRGRKPARTVERMLVECIRAE